MRRSCEDPAERSCVKILKMLCMVLYRALKEGYSGDPGGTLSNKQVLA